MTLIESRYSEFETLRNELISTFPKAAQSLPALPPKSIFCQLWILALLKIPWTDTSADRFRPSFLEKRRAGLEYFLKFVYPLDDILGMLTKFIAVYCWIRSSRARLSLRCSFLAKRSSSTTRCCLLELGPCGEIFETPFFGSSDDPGELRLG